MKKLKKKYEKMFIQKAKNQQNLLKMLEGKFCGEFTNLFAKDVVDIEEW